MINSQLNKSISITNKDRTKVLVLFACLALLAVVNESRAQERMASSPLLTGHYTPGMMNIRDFANPAPVSGLLILDYNTWLSGNKFYNNEGKQVTEIVGPTGNAIKLDPDVNGYMNSPLAFWVAKNKVLGATYFVGAMLPIVTVNPNLAYARIGIVDSIHKSGNFDGKVSGLSDIAIMPITLSWGFKNLDITGVYMFYAPTGKFKTGGEDNIGLGFWSHLLQVFGYWYPMKIKGEPSKALAIMLAPTLELTGIVKDIDVHPGNRFSLDYGISQFFTNKLELGIYGGNNWQISNDKGTEVYWNGAIKDQLSVFGFQASYWLWANRLQIIGKYGINYGAEQRFKQNTIGVNLIFITNALTGNKVSKDK